MDSKSDKKKIIIVVSLMLVIVIALATTLFVVFGTNDNKKDTGPDANNMTNTQITVSDYFKNYAGNESIIKNKLSTSNYTGSYVLDKVVSVEFNRYSESNKGGLSEENIQTLIKNSGTSDENGFKNYVYKRRKAKADTFNLFFKTKDKWHETDYGTFTAVSSNESTSQNYYDLVTGYVYGDENLAIIRLSEVDSNFFVSNKSSDSLKTVLYISLNYGSQLDAASVTDSTNTKDSIIYVFEDVYSSNNTNLKLFTVTYAFKCKTPTSPSIPGTDLGF